MKYVYVRLAEERGRAISAGHRIWVTTPHKDTPAPCCKYEEQHVKHEHLSLNSFIVVYVWIIIAVIITFLTCYMFGNRPYSRITMSRFIRLNLWKNIFWIRSMKNHFHTWIDTSDLSLSERLVLGIVLKETLQSA